MLSVSSGSAGPEGIGIGDRLAGPGKGKVRGCATG